ncbi:MAG: GTP-binding protein [Oscillospiraceae bacterium]|nr:GTP-binding protein [Oscillospiraceae bacterium]
MPKVDIFSGFLGAGKTTLIKKLIAEAYAGEKLVLIENEFGEIGIDGGFLSEVGVNITEMNSGCICCSLVGDFSRALAKVVEQFSPDRILIEPSGVGKLSEVAQAVLDADIPGLSVGRLVTVADASKCRAYMKNFGEFYSDQIESASVIVLTRTEKLTADKLDECVHMLRSMNADAVIITTPIALLGADSILSAAENTLDAALASLRRELEEHHHDHHDDHDEHHHHDHDHDEHDHDEHDHDEHDHDEHDHHHVHDEHHHHDHDGHHHHDHDADEIFTAWGRETGASWSRSRLESILAALDDEARFGTVLRAKGIVPSDDGGWLHFDYVPGEAEIRAGGADITGRLCVIGSQLNEAALEELFAPAAEARS